MWLWVELKEEEFEKVGEGVTGPRERRERAKSGSAASRLIAEKDREREPISRQFRNRVESR